MVGCLGCWPFLPGWNHGTRNASTCSQQGDHLTLDWYNSPRPAFKRTILGKMSTTSKLGKLHRKSEKSQDLVDNKSTKIKHPTLPIGFGGMIFWDIVFFYNRNIAKILWVQVMNRNIPRLFLFFGFYNGGNNFQGVCASIVTIGSNPKVYKWYWNRWPMVFQQAMQASLQNKHLWGVLEKSSLNLLAVALLCELNFD